eukprot:sb/3466716/
MVEQNKDLVYRQSSMIGSAKTSKFVCKQDFWAKVTHIVNESSGSTRDVKEVRRKWVTFQSEVKSKARDVNSANLLSDHERRVWDLITEMNSHEHFPAQTEKLSMLQKLPEPLGTQQIKPVSSPTGSSSTLPLSTSLPDLNLMKTHQQSIPVSVSGSDNNASPTTPYSTGGGATAPYSTNNTNTDADTKMLMNLCSQVVLGGGLTGNDLIKDIILGNTATTPSPAKPQAPTIRNVVSVQPTSIETPPKRARTLENTTPASSPVPNLQLEGLLMELVGLQRAANLVSEQRLEVEKEKRDIERERLAMEKARYELEKERLCQEIISRNK